MTKTNNKTILLDKTPKIQISVYCLQQISHSTDFKMPTGLSSSSFVFSLLITVCVLVSSVTESGRCIHTGWRHLMTAAGKMTRMTLLNRWYRALAALSFTTPSRNAWLNIRTGEHVKTKFRRSKTAWWISKRPEKNSWGSSSCPPPSLRPAEYRTSCKHIQCCVWNLTDNLKLQRLYLI